MAAKNHPKKPCLLLTADPVICNGIEVFELPEPVGVETGTLVGLNITT